MSNIKDLEPILEIAVQSPLGILGLSIMALSFIAYKFFKNEGWKIKLTVFLFLFTGVVTAGRAVIQNIPDNDLNNNTSVDNSHVETLQNEKNLNQSKPLSKREIELRKMEYRKKKKSSESTGEK